jgi:hypothetical protein
MNMMMRIVGREPVEVPALSRQLRVVLTGGPGAGKTVIASTIAADQPDRCACIPEAATQVYQAMQTRWDLLDDTGKREVQRRIYARQVEQEQLAVASGDRRIVLLDRGTVDGAAYWPDGPEDYWRELRTTEGAELDRYDAVIWLQTCATLGLYDGPSSNPCRAELPAQAIHVGQKLAQAWFRHPRLYRVDAFPTVEEKIDMVQRMLDLISMRMAIVE